MAVDLRAILAAFHEKGWALYEVHFSRIPVRTYTGPIDNFVLGINYRLFPATKSPLNLGSVIAEFEAAKRAGAHHAQYNVPDEGRTVDVSFVCLTPRHKDPLFLSLILDAYERRVDLPLERAAQLLRENLSAYERGQDGTT